MEKTRHQNNSLFIGNILRKCPFMSSFRINAFTHERMKATKVSLKKKKKMNKQMVRPGNYS